MRALDSLALHLPAAELGVGTVGVLETLMAGGEVDLAARLLSRVFQFGHVQCGKLKTALLKIGKH